MNTLAVDIDGTSFAAGRVLTITRTSSDVTVAAGDDRHARHPHHHHAHVRRGGRGHQTLGLAGSADVVADVE